MFDEKMRYEAPRVKVKLFYMNGEVFFGSFLLVAHHILYQKIHLT